MMLSVLLPLILAASVPPQVDTVAPKPIPLRGEWSFQTGDNLAWAGPELDDRTWVKVPVPGVWEDVVGDHDGFDSYRRMIELPAELAEGPVGVQVGTVGDAFELYWNGVLIGAGGASLRGSRRPPSTPLRLSSRRASWRSPPTGSTFWPCESTTSTSTAG